jgi:hypothetical protein
MNVAAEEAAEKVVYFVIPSEERNLSSIYSDEKKERFHSSRNDKRREAFFSASCEAAAHKINSGDSSRQNAEITN